jgi:hypothetical protein
MRSSTQDTCTSTHSTHIRKWEYAWYAVYIVITQCKTSFTFIVYERVKDRLGSILLNEDLFNT